MRKLNYKTLSITLFGLFMALFFLLALFKNDITTWIWQLCIPILLIAQVIVVLNSREESRKHFGSDWYENK